MRIARLAVALGFAGVAVAAVLLLWPLHANGVSGSAMRPHFRRYFAFSTFGPLPDHPTLADLRRAGVQLPGDVVERRRHRAEAVELAGLLLATGGAVAMTRHSGRRVRAGEQRG